VNVASNPVLARLVQRDRWPSLRMVLWIAFGLGLASLTVATVTILRMGPDLSGNTGLFLWIASWLITALAPPLVGVTALLFVDRDVRNGVFELLRLTLVSEKALVWGYALAALYRWRIFLTLVVGVMPVLVVGMLQTHIITMALVYQILPPMGLGGYQGGFPRDVDVQRAIVDAIALEATAVGMWGMNGLAAVLGVGLGYRFRDRIWIVVTFLTLLLATLAFPLFLFVSAEWSRFALAPVAMALPYVLTCLGARWVAASEPGRLTDISLWMLG